MKNIINNYRMQPFYPCGLQIPQDKIFASARNLGLSLMSALTGTPTEYLQLNRAEISIGLGCFGLIGLNCTDYNQGDNIEFIDEDTDWGLTSLISYELYNNAFSHNTTVATFDFLSFSITPEDLVCKERGCISSVQLFGPSRLLRKLKSDRLRMSGPFAPSELDIEHYLEYGQEPNDAILTPSEEEFELYWDAKDPQEKFRILLNMVTTFASTVSAKLMNHGYVRLSCLHLPSDDAMSEIGWFRDGKLPPMWKPTMEQVKREMKASKLKKSDIDPEVRKLLWPRKKG